MTRPPPIRARIVQETTVKGKERFRVVKPGDVVEFDKETFDEYVRLGLADKTPLPPKKPKPDEADSKPPAAGDKPDPKLADSAGNPIITR